jgi:hypothetical protein
MEVPRMEEQYQRQARAVVRQQEVANTLKEIGWKRLEGDVKSLNFWKNKTKSLEETVVKQKVELENLTAQARLNLSRYQSLLTSFNQLKKASTLAGGAALEGKSSIRPASASGKLMSRPASSVNFRADVTGGDGFGASDGGGFGDGVAMGDDEYGGMTASTKSATMIDIMDEDELEDNAFSAAHHHSHHHASSASRRPSTAPATSKHHAHQASLQDLNNSVKNNTTAINANTNTDGGTTSLPRPASSATLGGTGGRAKSHKSSVNLDPTQRSVFKKTLHAISAAELERLRQAISARDATIAKLSRKLSHARAYPLTGINVPGYNHEEDDIDIMGMGPAASAAASVLSKKSGVSGSMGGSFRGSGGLLQDPGGDDDEELESASFIAEEEKLQQQRIDNALEIQRKYSVHAAKLKESNPPHMRAIRAAKSFAAHVTENIPSGAARHNSNSLGLAVED